ncbi:MAG: hypothetical protein ACPG4T_03335 [Nannocystaceae bacterium]
MGLDVTHGCWSGGYGHFNSFRKDIAAACGGSFPPHKEDVKAHEPDLAVSSRWFYDERVVPTEHVAGMLVLMRHSDCDGEIQPKEAEAVAGFLMWVEPRLAPAFRENARRFASGCLVAASLNEPVEFH